MDEQELTDFPSACEARLPAFSDEGVLPPGDFRPTRAQFEERFVRSGNRERREAIYEGWNRHREALMQAGLRDGTRQLLNGSYTEAKAAPGDIDIAVEVPADREMLSTSGMDHPVVRLLQGSDMREEYWCDAYPIFVLP